MNGWYSWLYNSLKLKKCGIYPIINLKILFRGDAPFWWDSYGLPQDFFPFFSPWWDWSHTAAANISASTLDLPPRAIGISANPARHGGTPSSMVKNSWENPHRSIDDYDDYDDWGYSPWLSVYWWVLFWGFPPHTFIPIILNRSRDDPHEFIASGNCPNRLSSRLNRPQKKCPKGVDFPWEIMVSMKSIP